ncbi:hypothetical protein O181_121002 [Austropuccinia psidii MF-1]|uniref:Uncharacterized protein n=1 Tax=Austropuccinia psidii MF-1 TaxID=1389203 RepID=A0A9Q3Q2Z1_9BASI|nr:hypothetical protein [Austropuccinia psidii MF-1]
MRDFSLNLGSNLLGHQETNILGFSNADWGETKEYKSFSGCLIYYFGTIGWPSHKQKVVALSSAEAEYNTLTECSQDLQWTRQLIYEATKVQFKSILHSDNQSAIAIASNHIYHHGTRHINFGLHFISDLIDNDKIELRYLDTNNMVADLLTKNFSKSRNDKHLKIMFGTEPLGTAV